jgi:hypothetical protein
MRDVVVAMKEKMKMQADTEQISDFPGQIAIGGLEEKALTFDCQELADLMTLDEGVYRFRGAMRPVG